MLHPPKIIPDRQNHDSHDSRKTEPSEDAIFCKQTITSFEEANQDYLEDDKGHKIQTAPAGNMDMWFTYLVLIFLNHLKLVGKLGIHLHW